MLAAHRLRSGPAGDAPAERLRELGIAEHAELRGYVAFGPELMEVYRSSHAFLHVSWTEGFPQVLLEAFAAGIPVVATDVGGVRAAVGEVVRLVPPGDAEAAIGELQGLAERCACPAELISAAHRYVERRTLPREAKRVAEFLVADDVMRALRLATRFPGGRKSGRKAVIETIMRSLLALGHEVEIGVLAKPEADPLPSGLEAVPIHQLDPPRLARVAWNASTQFLPGRISLNECLYYSPQLQREASGLIAGGRFDVVVADTIRVVGLADRSDPPLIVDFDDLFSTRYADLEAAGGNPESLLGYYARSLPRTLVKPLAMIAGPVLRREAKVLRRREVALARSSAAVSLVGEQEAAELAVAVGVPVAWLPMAVPVVDPIAPVARNPGDRFACLGGMDFQANLLLLRWFADEVLPAVLELCPDFHLQMIGDRPDRVRDELTRPGLSFAGYVDDLEDELRQYRGFVAPITTVTGVKTKVLDAMALGFRWSPLPSASPA